MYDDPFFNNFLLFLLVRNGFWTEKLAKIGMSNIQIFNVVVEIYFSYSKRTEEASNRILTQLKPTGLLTIRQALNKAEYSSMTAVVSVTSDKRLKLADFRVEWPNLKVIWNGYYDTY